MGYWGREKLGLVNLGMILGLVFGGVGDGGWGRYLGMICKILGTVVGDEF